VSTIVFWLDHNGSSSFVKKASFVDTVNSSNKTNSNSDDNSGGAIHNETEDSLTENMESITSCLDPTSNTCPICLEDLDSRTSIIVSNPTVCIHTFHRDCLVERLSNNHASAPVAGLTGCQPVCCGMHYVGWY